MRAIAPDARSTQAPKPARFDPTLVRYSLRWLGAGAALSTLATLAVQRGGNPTATMLGIAGLAGATYATLLEPRRPVLERIILRLPTLPPALEGLRIGQLSDLHLGHVHTYANTAWAVQQMVREQPDLLVMTGDYVNFEHAVADLPHLLRPLRAPLGIYAVPGNHDHLEGLEHIQDCLAPLGVTFLINSHRRLSWRGATLWLVGVDDMWSGGADLDAALTNVPADGFKLLLVHEPDMADMAAERNVALQFSGHTHGGHLCLPLLGSFCLPLYGLRYPVGLERVGSTYVYVSRGLGGMPLRLGCPPEATIFTLTRGR